MADYYKIDLSSLLISDSYTEASREELRVLLALASMHGDVPSTDLLAKKAAVSAARCRSALTLWEESGVIAVSKKDADGDTRAVIIDEFEPNPLSDDFDEELSEDVAESIRNKGLADLISECTALMERTSLNTQEIKKICALVTQYALKEEFILTLAAHLKEKESLTVRRLFDKAIKLIEKGIDTTENLEKYIQNCEISTGAEWDLRHLFGVYGKTLTKNQKKFFKRWTEEFGYSATIVSEAYNITVDINGKASLPYIDAILAKWAEAGCKTVEECLEIQEKYRLAKKAEYSAKKSSAKKSEETETPKYTDFDTEDALMRALQRSYGTDSN